MYNDSSNKEIDMKKKFLIGLTTLLGISTSAFADKVLIDTKVTYAKNGRIHLKAYKKVDNCHSWLYHPGYYETTGTPIVTRRGVSIPLINEQTQTSQNKMGLTANVNFQIKSPIITSEDELELKRQIVKEVNGKRDTQSNTNPYYRCPKLSIDDISLNVISVNAMSSLKESKNSGQFDSIRTSMQLGRGYNQYSDVEINTLGKFPVILKLDATHPDVNTEIIDTFNQPGNSIGTLGLKIDGITKSINSSIRVKNSMFANFSSHKLPVCSTSNEQKSSSGAFISTMGIGIGASDTNTTTRKCQEQVVTAMTKGMANGDMKFDHQLPLEGRTYVEIDDNGEAKTYPLKQWVESKLLSMWVESNFDIVSVKISDGVFANTLGRKGDSNGDVDFEVSITEAQHKNEGIDAAIYVHDMNTDLISLRALNNEMTRCLQSNYWDQEMLYIDYIDLTAFIPVADACLN